MELWSGKASNETLEYLLKRRSVKAADMGKYGPAPEQLEQMLEAASRVPDHGKAVPFYFLVFEGDARAQAGEIIAHAYAAQNPDAGADKIDQERGRFVRAPLVVGIIMRPRMSKNPLWEQMLTCGAAAQNFLLAANALGFGAQWLTEWYAYDDYVRAEMGLDEQDIVAGFMYVGSVEAPISERDRPDLNAIVNHWSPDAVLKKGDEYHREKFGYPDLGFDVKVFKAP